ncbi:hypothetical protein D3C81_1987920 [compost metagenome]
MWDLGQQRGVTGDVEALFQRLLHAAPINIINFSGIQRRVTAQHGTHQMSGKIFRANLAESAAF